MAPLTATADFWELLYSTMPETERRRKRAAVSCVLCRRRKIKCNRESPCSNCLRSRNGVCIYEPFPSASTTAAVAPQRRPTSAARESPLGSMSSASSIQSSPVVTQSLASRPSVEQRDFNGERLILDSVAIPDRQRHNLLGPTNPAVSMLMEPGHTSGIDPIPPQQSTSPTDDLTALKARIQMLEAQVSSFRATTASTSPRPSLVSGGKSSVAGLTPGTSGISPPSTTGAGPHTHIETQKSSFGGTFYLHKESTWSGQEEPVTCNISHKTRLFGQSHWSNNVMHAMIEPMIIIDTFLKDPESRGTQLINRCKQISRMIKAERCPAWPAPLTNDLPSKAVCDELVSRYMRTIESVYRIVHIPTFMKLYERLWDGSPRDPGFLAQVKLVLTLGSLSYDDDFTLRIMASRWLYEAVTWLSDPDFKSRLHLELMQSKIMIVIAREMLGIGSHMVWVLAGDLQRLAIVMGLHRDPTHLPKMSLLATEMRRRLWYTILELSVSSAVIAGTPPLLSLDHFDTQPPQNYDDLDLLNEASKPKPDSVITDMSVPIAMGKSLESRLRIVRFLNDLGCSARTYADAMQLDAEFRQAYKQVVQLICNEDPKRKAPVSDAQYPRTATLFARRWVEAHLRHIMFSLHIRFIGKDGTVNAHAYSRKTVLESCLAFCAACHVEGQQVGSTDGKSNHDDMTLMSRLVINGSGSLRLGLMQAAYSITTEMQLQIKESEESMGLSQVRVGLLDTVNDIRKIALRCIETGEKNVKGYVGLSLSAKHVELCLHRIPPEERGPILVKQLEEDAELCLTRLEKHLDSLKLATGSNSPMKLTSALIRPFGGAGDMAQGGMKTKQDGCFLEAPIQGMSTDPVVPTTDGVEPVMSDAQMLEWQTMQSLDLLSGEPMMEQMGWIFEDEGFPDMTM